MITGYLIQEIAMVIVSLQLVENESLNVELFLIPLFLLVAQSVLYAIFLQFSKYDFDLTILAKLSKSALSAPSWTKNEEANKITTAFYKIGYYITLIFGSVVFIIVLAGAYYDARLLPNSILISTIIWMGLILTGICIIFASYLVSICAKKFSVQAHKIMKEKGYE